jgi:hypothetical protein
MFRDADRSAHGVPINDNPMRCAGWCRRLAFPKQAREDDAVYAKRDFEQRQRGKAYPKSGLVRSSNMTALR